MARCHFNASGSALNLGDLSDTVTNAINQLPDVPAEADRPSLKDLLVQLQKESFPPILRLAKQTKPKHWRR